jgi:hypothetical protein
MNGQPCHVDFEKSMKMLFLILILRLRCASVDDFDLDRQAREDMASSTWPGISPYFQLC